MFKAWLVLASCLYSSVVTVVVGQGSPGSICPLYPIGSSLNEPMHLFSSNGILEAELVLETEMDIYGNQEYCYLTQDGKSRSPVLHVKPGDNLYLTLHNALPAGNDTNFHFHGMTVSPMVGQDNVLSTKVSPGQSFFYNVSIPFNHAPGIYWYHDHMHGLSELHVLGGASGAIIVDGIENLIPIVASLPTRTLVMRGNLVPGNLSTESTAPAWDLSLNFIPIPFPNYTTVNIAMQPGSTEFWRLVNAAADNILNLQILYDGVAQVLRVIALDGVELTSRDSNRTTILVPPAGRAEFIVHAPSQSVMNATLVTLFVDTGPDGDNTPSRPLATIVTTANASVPNITMPDVSGNGGGDPNGTLIAQLLGTIPVQKRSLYFSEIILDPSDPNSPTNFYITVDGQRPTIFKLGQPPSIITTQGTVEDWTIENQAQEVHEFHIHQLHFLVLNISGVPVPTDQLVYIDTINIPYWNGTNGTDGLPLYPSITVRMDFTRVDEGDFVYHCHILQHEDQGMMAIIRVQANNNSGTRLTLPLLFIVMIFLSALLQLVTL